MPIKGEGLKFILSARGRLILLFPSARERAFTPHKSLKSQRFRGLLEDFYPWEPDEDKEKKSGSIYEIVRNPLSHSLGLLEKGSAILRKDPLSEELLEEIEHSRERPNWLQQAVKEKRSVTFIDVRGLCWGVFQMLWRLAKNTPSMEEAERYLMNQGGKDPFSHNPTE